MHTEYILLAIWVALHLPLILWELRKEPRDILKKYPKPVRIEMIDADDLERLSNHRKIRLRLFLTLNVFPSVLLFLYLWLKHGEISHRFPIE